MSVLPTELGSIAVAAVAAGGAWASQRAASRASRVNTQVSGRLDAEKEAYERARQFDIETIKRQNEELRDLREQLAQMRERLAILERNGPPSTLERMLLERLDEKPGDQEQ